jgi:hypothetical protein
LPCSMSDSAELGAAASAGAVETVRIKIEM